MSAPLQTAGPSAVVVQLLADAQAAMGLRESGLGRDDAATSGTATPAPAWLALPAALGATARSSIVLANAGETPIRATLQQLPARGRRGRRPGHDHDPARAHRDPAEELARHRSDGGGVRDRRWRPRRIERRHDRQGPDGRLRDGPRRPGAARRVAGTLGGIIWPHPSQASARRTVHGHRSARTQTSSSRRLCDARRRAGGDRPGGRRRRVRGGALRAGERGPHHAGGHDRRCRRERDDTHGGDRSRSGRGRDHPVRAAHGVGRTPALDGHPRDARSARGGRRLGPRRPRRGGRSRHPRSRVASHTRQFPRPGRPARRTTRKATPSQELVATIAAKVRGGSAERGAPAQRGHDRRRARAREGWHEAERRQGRAEDRRRARRRRVEAVPRRPGPSRPR